MSLAPLIRPSGGGPADRVGDREGVAVEIDLRRQCWLPVLTSAAPGIATGLPCGDRLRVAVVELPALSATAVRRTLRRTATWPLEAAADALADLDRWSSRPTMAVADLAPDGALELALRDAPPAIVLSPDRAARTVGPADTSAVLRPQDALLICSATFLENPPESLSRIRDSGHGGSAVDELRRALAQTGQTGATALVRRSTEPEPTGRASLIAAGAARRLLRGRTG
jgi:hypothetical protein